MTTWLISDQAVPGVDGFELIVLGPNTKLAHDAALQVIKGTGVASVLDRKEGERNQKQASTGNDILFIDLFLTFQDPEFQHQQDLGGLGLLKFLRIKGVRNHIVLLSPWNLLELLRMNPGYHVLASEGITIAQYTYSPDELKDHVGMPLKYLKPIPGDYDLRPWFKAGISLPKDERHNWANWWGLHALIEEHNGYEGRVGIVAPEPLVKKLKVLRNAEASFVFDAKPTKGKGDYPELQRLPRIVYIDDQANEGWMTTLCHVIYGSEVEHQMFATVVPDRGTFSSEESLRTFYNGQIAPVLFDKATGPYCGAELVVLDLRLDPAHDHGVANLEKTSGMRLLNVIRQGHPGVPVLMFTASTSATMRNFVLQNGVDRVWTKPGVDGPMDRGSLVELLDILRVLTNHSYQGLRRLGIAVKHVEDNASSAWWTTAHFTEADTTGKAIVHQSNGNPSKQKDILLGIIELCRTLLRDVYVGISPSLSAASKLHGTSLLNRFGLIPELFHGYQAKLLDTMFDSTKGPGDKKNHRGDVIGWQLYAMRNWSSHSDSATSFREEYLTDALDLLTLYIIHPRFPEWKCDSTDVALIDRGKQMFLDIKKPWTGMSPTDKLVKHLVTVGIVDPTYWPRS